MYLSLLIGNTKIPNLTFRGPCIVIYSYNESQQDALSLNFILVKNSTCFGQIYCPSLGVLLLYSQQLVRLEFRQFQDLKGFLPVCWQFLFDWAAVAWKAAGIISFFRLHKGCYFRATIVFLWKVDYCQLFISL